MNLKTRILNLKTRPQITQYRILRQDKLILDTRAEMVVIFQKISGSWLFHLCKIWKYLPSVSSELIALTLSSEKEKKKLPVPSF